MAEEDIQELVTAAVASDRKPATSWTSSDVRTVVLGRHSKEKGFVVLEEVSDNGGSRKADVVALHCWGRPHAIGYEIKVSRSDWLREAADPDKQKWIEENCRYRWFICPPGIIEKSEVPAGWGLVYTHGKPGSAVSRRIVVAPAHDVPPIQRWLARQLFKIDGSYHTEKGLRSSIEDRLKESVLAEKWREFREVERAFQERVERSKQEMRDEKREVDAQWRAILNLAHQHKYAYYESPPDPDTTSPRELFDAMKARALEAACAEVRGAKNSIDALFDKIKSFGIVEAHDD